MKADDIVRLRLTNQRLTGTFSSSPSEIAGWMGALQAQDYNMAKWAFGIRMQNAVKNTVDQAINNSEIIRTHLLRPTWHFVSSGNLLWLLGLTSPRIKQSLKSRNASLGLDNNTLELTNTIISEALKGGKQLIREEISKVLESEGVSTGDNRTSHILLWAELSGIICSGRQSGNKPTYALISETVQESQAVSRDEYLGMLAAKYFTSHGPATIRDFAWWSGLSVTDIKTGIRMAGDVIENFRGTDTEYWSGRNSCLNTGLKSVLLLPAYDEYIISYSDRSAVLTRKNHAKAISANGFFRPLVLINGKVAGLWKPSVNKEKLIIGITLFGSVPRYKKIGIEDEAERYGYFIGKKADVNFSE